MDGIVILTREGSTSYPIGGTHNMVFNSLVVFFHGLRRSSGKAERVDTEWNPQCASFLWGNSLRVAWSTDTHNSLLIDILRGPFFVLSMERDGHGKDGTGGTRSLSVICALGWAFSMVQELETELEKARTT